MKYVTGVTNSGTAGFCKEIFIFNHRAENIPAKYYGWYQKGDWTSVKIKTAPTVVVINPTYRFLKLDDLPKLEINRIIVAGIR